MLLGAERRTRIRQRIEPILKEYNQELAFIAVFVDSTREFLGVVAQLEERPLLLKFRWVDFISTPDSQLREEVFSPDAIADIFSHAVESLYSKASSIASRTKAKNSLKILMANKVESLTTRALVTADIQAGLAERVA